MLSEEVHVTLAERGIRSFSDLCIVEINPLAVLVDVADVVASVNRGAQVSYEAMQLVSAIFRLSTLERVSSSVV